MNQQMQNILLELSVCHDPEPEVIFRRIVQAIADIYGGPMALINLVEGERLRFRAVVNPHPKFQNKTITLQATF